MLLAVHIVMAILCLCFAILFNTGRGEKFITGYSTADEQKKQSINKKAFLKKCSRIMFGVSFAFFILCLSDILSSKGLLLLGIMLLLVLGFLSTIYIVSTFSQKK